MPINDLTSRILKMFCSEYKARPYLHEPIVVNGYAYATDSFIAIKARSELSDTPIDSKQKNYFNILDHIFSKQIKKNYKVTCDKLDMVINLFDKQPVMSTIDMIDCPECKSHGFYECPHCGQDMDCTNCNGEGTIGKPKPTGEMEFVNHTYAYIADNTVIDGNYLIKIREIARDLGQNFVEFQFQSDTVGINDYNIDPLFCEIGDVLVLIMPLKVSRTTESYSGSQKIKL